MMVPVKTIAFDLACAVVLLGGAMEAHAVAVSETVSLESTDSIKKIAQRLSDYEGVSNTDETVRVAGNAFNAVDKQIIMGFVEDVRARLQMLTGASFMGAHYRVLISAKRSDPDRPCMITTQLMSPALGRQRLPTIRISVLNVEKLDARDLAREICDGFIRLKVLTLAEREEEPVSPPRWFSAGIARYLDLEQRQDDAEDVLMQWRGARLPPLWVLAAGQSPFASACDEVAAQIAAYWLSFPDRDDRLEALCRALASGRSWSPELFIETSSNAGSLLRADHDFDVWLLNRNYTVLTPGTTRSELVVRAYYLLMLRPGVDGVPSDVSPVSPLTLLVERLDEPWVRVCARTKSDRLMRLAAGRGDKFRKTAVTYAEFFDGITRKEPPSKLFAKLRLAELLLHDSAEK